MITRMRDLLADGRCDRPLDAALELGKHGRTLVPRRRHDGGVFTISCASAALPNPSQSARHTTRRQRRAECLPSSPRRRTLASASIRDTRRTRGEAMTMRNVLVISSSERPVAALRAALGEDIDEFGSSCPPYTNLVCNGSRTQTTTRESGPTTRHPRSQTRCPPKRQRHPPATRIRCLPLKTHFVSSPQTRS